MEYKDKLKEYIWLVWLLLGFILTVIAALFFARSLRCLLEYQINEAEAALMIALASATAAIFTLVLPDGARKFLLSLLGGIVPALFLSVVVAASWFSPTKEECFPKPTMTVTPTSTFTLTLTTTWTPVLSPMHTGTLAPTPGTQVAVEIDEQDAGDGFCREIAPNSSHIIQVTVLDSAGVPLPPGTFSYRWRFNPPDSHNEEKIKEDFRCNAIAYYASAELDNQTVTVEVLKEKKTVIVRSVCFNIARLP